MGDRTKNTQKRFVVLFHKFPPEHQRANHWDLMLEADGTLLTWALDEMLQPGKSIEATRLNDHRADYLEYEGPVSGSRGSVSRVLSGNFLWMPDLKDRIAVLTMETETWHIEFEQLEGGAFAIDVRAVTADR